MACMRYLVEFSHHSFYKLFQPFAFLFTVDPFLRSIACWATKKYHKALRTLLVEPGFGSVDMKYNKLAASGSPDIFNFYVFLRTHPVLRRTQFEKHTKGGTPQLKRKVKTKNY